MVYPSACQWRQIIAFPSPDGPAARHFATHASNSARTSGRLKYRRVADSDSLVIPSQQNSRIVNSMCAMTGSHPGLVADITEILGRTGLPADHLQLEISKNALADNHHTMIATLNALANLGVRLAIDEFGTGYANLTHLRELPVHSLKLAGSLVRCLQTPYTSDPIGETLLTTLISLGHALGLTFTAEGVQTPVQAQRLAAIGCELGQGHYLGRPATPRRISQLFTRR